MKQKLVAIGIIGALGVLGYFYFQPKPAPSMSGASENAALVEVEVPELAGNAALGEAIYNQACADCHGGNGAGQDGVAPPLVHVIYEPNHHADEAFQRAVALGVKSHHWRFGNMAPVTGLTRGDVTMVIAYIRDLQRANGIN